MDRAAPAASPQPIHLRDYTPPTHLIDAVNLTVELRDDWTKVRAILRGRRNPAAGEGPAPIVLDGQDQQLVSVMLDSRRLTETEYTLEPERLTLPAVDGPFEVVIETRIRPQENTALEGLYRSGDLYCTQCEAEGFRRITYYPDRPDVMAVFTVRIEADKDRFPVLLANGNRVETGDLPFGRHYAEWHDPFRKPAYLFAMVAGDLGCVEDRFVTRSGRDVTLRIYVDHGNEDRTGHAMESLKRSMKWDEEVYGLEYDLDIFMIVAVSAFNMGAMENKGLNIFNDKFILADPATATDADFQRVEGVVAHEYFHNWTGNRITCRDWFQLSLKEGLTVFRDQEFSADMHNAGVKRVADARLLRTVQFPEDAGPTAHPVRPDTYIEINNFYTVTIYEKGAEVVRMIHTLLGAEAYRKGIDLYVERHDGQAVTCDDFVAAMEDASGVDLSQFRLWYSQAGTPTVTARWTHDPVTRQLDLTLSQSLPSTPGQSGKRPMPIPIRTALIGRNGSAVPMRTANDTDGASEAERVVVLDRDAMTVSFLDVAPGTVPSLLRGFSAPVKLDAAWTEDDLAFLAGTDNDPFGRWEALQSLATRALLAMVTGLRDGRSVPLDPRVIAAFKASLADDALEPAFLAELLSLPGESLLGQALDIWHVDEVHAARGEARRMIGEALFDGWAAAYDRLSAADAAGEGGSDVSTAAMGRRALGNVALGYLVASGREDGVARAVAQARPNGMMTRVMGGLAALNDLERPERDAALEAFHQRWSDSPLVLDKWFALKAGSARRGTLGEVVSLLDHPGFSLRNPNRVRALIGGFTAGNPVRFHEADGSGYNFLADQVLALDPMNPQVAARMTQPLVRWRKFDAGRGQAMTDALRRIVARPNLSKDVYEIASKALS
ncbi:aminopeptidase N [alpha proteobacterium BAL199]|jgi:aminopeptidase N|nr:aminopeptidase N [alpha proteobacterium BAL199]